MKRMLGVIICLVAVVGCTNTGPKELGGTLVGAGVGGLVGSQIGGGTGQVVATGLGVLIGGLVGSEVGRSLDRADRLEMEQATQRSLESAPSGQVTTWRNPDTGHSGTVEPVRTYETSQGAYCREFQQTISVGGKVEKAYGTACRQPDGTWKIVQ